jgi:hypothetical protein
MFCHPRTSGGRFYKYLTAEGQLQTVPYQLFERGVLHAVVDLRARDVDGRHEADALTVRVESLQEQRARYALELVALDQQIRELPPARWPKRVVARMAELEELVSQKDDELRAAKEAANSSGRVEALVDLRTSVELLDKLAGQEDRPRLEAVRRRIKARLPLLVESIWVRVQVLHKRGRYVHVRLYLHGGEQRYFVLPCGYVAAAPPLRLDGADFRAGAERGYARKARKGAKPVTKRAAG